MGDEITTAGSAAPGQSAPKERAPRSPEALAASNRAAAARRVLGKLKGVKSVDDLYAKVDELRGKPTEAKKPDTTAGAAQPSSVPEVPKGWPSQAAVAAVVPDLYVQAQIALSLFPEKYRPPIRVIEVQTKQPDGSFATEQKRLDPAERLAMGCAPFVAQITEGAQTTPARAALITAALVLAPPTVRMLWDLAAEKFGAWRAARASAEKPKAGANVVELRATTTAPQAGGKA